MDSTFSDSLLPPDAFLRRNSDSPAVRSVLIQSKSLGQELLASLDDFRINGLFTDAVLCTGQEEFPCHKAVLAASSPYFQAMFAGNFVERGASRVVLTNVTASTLRRMLDWVYTGKLELSDECAQDILAAAHLLQYQGLVQACATFVEAQLDVHNCLGIEQFAELHNLIKLAESAHQFAVENFGAVTQTDEFLHLPSETLLRYLSADSIDVQSEEEVFAACVRWVKQSPDSRSDLLPDLLGHVRLVHLGERFTQHCALLEPLVLSCPRALKLLKQQTAEEDIIRRPSTVRRESLVFLSQGGTALQVYNYKKCRWSSLAPLTQSAEWFAATVLRNDILVTGGIREEQVLDTMSRFDSSQCRWHRESSMLSPRAKHAAAAAAGRLLVLGGLTPRTESGRGVQNGRGLCSLCRVDSWCPDTKQWTTVGHTPEPMNRAESSLAVWPCPEQSTLLLLEAGGLRQPGDFICDTMDTYRVKQTADSYRVDFTGEHFVLPRPLRRARLVVLQSFFYILWEETGEFYQLDPDKRRLRKLPSPQHCRRQCAFTLMQGRIYVAGGVVVSKDGEQQVGDSSSVSNGSQVSPVECYDPVANCWTSVKSIRWPAGSTSHTRSPCALLTVEL